MRQTLRKLYLDLFGTFAKPARGVHILNGHYLSPGKEEASVFREQLNALREGCILIRIEEAVAMIVNRTKVSDPLVAFTFDDGFEEQATSIAPGWRNTASMQPSSSIPASPAEMRRIVKIFLNTG